MINENDFPKFKYFMEAYIADHADFFEQAYKFSKSESIRIINKLKNEVMDLSSKKEVWEVQSFLIRKYGIRIRQKEVPIIFEEILKGLGS